MATWYNNDGLTVKFGTEKSTPNKVGSYGVGDGPIHVMEVFLSDLTLLGTSPAIQSDVATLPAGARIERVEIINQTAATSGGSAVLNVGLQRLDRSTELDYDGLVAAAALATFNAAGERVTLNVGSTGAGALIGTTLANAGYITADYDTAAFTAGALRVRIEWVKVL
jgi:hypothetical protein